MTTSTEPLVAASEAAREAAWALRPEPYTDADKVAWNTRAEPTPPDASSRDRALAEDICESVFILTRHECALKIERGRELMKASSILRNHPEFEARLENIFDALSVMVCETLLQEEWIKEAEKKIREVRSALQGGSNGQG